MKAAGGSETPSVFAFLARALWCRLGMYPSQPPTDFGLRQRCTEVVEVLAAFATADRPPSISMMDAAGLR